MASRFSVFFAELKRRKVTRVAVACTAFKAMIESFNPNFTDHRIELRDINGYGDLAYAWGNYTETFSVSGAPEPITDVAKLMFGFRKQPDGSWLVATEMWNTDLS